MPRKYISIQDAAGCTKRSVQTIRRAIKAKKIKFRKQKTAQGFNYLINRESLYEFYKIKSPQISEIKLKEKLEIPKPKAIYKDVHVSAEDFKSFQKTLEKLIIQHSDERQNFIRLINTLQEKIFVLENQLNLLKSPSKKWYQFWR